MSIKECVAVVFSLVVSCGASLGLFGSCASWSCGVELAVWSRTCSAACSVCRARHVTGWCSHLFCVKQKEGCLKMLGLQHTSCLCIFHISVSAIES
jgi:hypothetical protein